MTRIASRLAAGCCLGLVALLIGCAVPAARPSVPADAGWASLFDGRSLAGWSLRCKPADKAKAAAFWRVDAGTILCDTAGDRSHDYIWLMTDREFGDFELELKVQGYRGVKGNTGVQVRSRYDEAAGWLDGPQIDVDPTTGWRTGLIYDETRGTRRWVCPSLPSSAIPPEHAPKGYKWKYADESDGWNDLRIVCRGTKIQTWLNGVPAADFDGRGVLDDEGHKARNVGLAGHIALQLHTRDDLRVRYKDIRIRPVRADKRSS